MTAQDLVERLQIVLNLRIRTGQITLNLREGRLETFETRTYAKLKEKPIEPPAKVAHTT